jgi:integrase
MKVFALVEAMPARYRAMVLLATFTSLRFGELAALRRRDIDLDGSSVTVRQGQVELSDGTLITKDPKSAAGKRVVAIPEVIIPDLRRHLEWFADRDPDGLIFVGPMGGQLRRGNFHKVWTKARASAGISADVHFHDLRHTGNNWRRARVRAFAS